MRPVTRGTVSPSCSNPVVSARTHLWLTGFPHSGVAELAAWLSEHPDVVPVRRIVEFPQMQGALPVDGIWEDVEAEMRAASAPAPDGRVLLEWSEDLLLKVPALVQVFPGSTALVCQRDGRAVALAVAANEPADWWLSRPTERVTKKMGQMLTPVGRALLSWHDENQRVAWDAAVPARFEELRDGGLAAGEALLRTLGLPPCQLPALKLPPDPHPGPLGYDELGLARLLS